MANDKQLVLLVERIELPDRAYELAKSRYDDLGAWFDREECSLDGNDPRIFVQGSFALGTAIRPPKEGQQYDLDLSCVLRSGVTRATHSQRQLKEMIGRELEGYRGYRQFDEPAEEKNRCWRLNYRDELGFHMDVVPGISADTARRAALTLLMEQRGIARHLAQDVAAQAVWITDKRVPSYNRLSAEWPSSNPEGYVRWFLSRMSSPQPLLEKRAQIDDVPIYRRKTALQRVVQLLKAHRDSMFASAPDSKPTSIVLTTIAAAAYEANESLTDSMTRVLDALEAFRRSNSDIVFNPVNPEENFADRWKLPEYRPLRLKENFHHWIIQARADFQYLMSAPGAVALMKRAQSALKVRLDENAAAAALGAAAGPSVASQPPRPRQVSIQAPPRPWSAVQR
ncbi:MAG TPA: nucleotidyltransferase [Steroidobacteraceae bacterium]|jgi:hypothetical protein|nr:nucleotidyltransferase [Steroidobacteraceae bacterium]